ncbi:MAG TPA: DUF2269 family protein [Actinomycetota bacterium]|nr:DUF2269 family protein [Actinomycetota bacterium]
MRTLLLYGHIVGAIVWIGGAIMFNVLSGRMRKAGNAEQVAHVIEESIWLGKSFYTPAALWVLVSGVTLVLTSSGAYQFQDIFVAVGIAVVIGSAITGGAYYGKEAEAIVQGAKANGIEAPDVQKRLDRIRLISWLEIAALLVVELLMVYRTGSY